jgi:hypothetical protein
MEISGNAKSFPGVVANDHVDIDAWSGDKANLHEENRGETY